MYLKGMDTAIIPTIVTGAVAIVAGLGGSALTGYFNRKNTVETLAAARQASAEQWTRSQEIEHRTWLRDNRQESYVAFFDEFEKNLTILRKHPREIYPVGLLDELETLRARIRLIGTDRIRIQAREIHMLLGQALIARNSYFRAALKHDAKLTQEESAALKTETQLTDKIEKARDAAVVFVDMVRDELRTADGDTIHSGTHVIGQGSEAPEAMGLDIESPEAMDLGIAPPHPAYPDIESPQVPVR